MTYSLLDDPLIRVRGPDGQRDTITLPEVFARVVADDLEAFEALQAHQKQPWFAFLVQVAAMGVARQGRDGLPDDVDAWRELLVDLSDGDELAWHLVVDDLSRPAFMQPPVPEGSLEKAKFKNRVATPDALDLLVTAKNHDVKQLRMEHPRPEHWTFALVSLQTLEGFMGRGNYGIMRMNGGFSSRPLVGLTPGLSWGTRFQRDVDVLLVTRQAAVDQFGYDPQGHALLWLLPWDGGKKSGVAYTDCDAYVVEICRRVRLIDDAGEIACLRANSQAGRIDAPKDLNGITGDPWTPVHKADAKALTLSAQGFHYRLLRELFLSEEYEAPAALRFSDSEADGGYLVATCLVRGQGKTEGFHERRIPVPGQVRRLWSEPDERERLFKMARQRTELAGTVRKSIVYAAIRTLLGAGSATASVDSDQIQRWSNAFDAGVDAIFFEDLWAALDLPADQARAQWQRHLHRLALDQLKDAIDSAPLPSIRRYRAISAAERVFHGSARKHLPDAYSDQTTDNPKEAAHV